MNTENELQEITGTRWQPVKLVYVVLTGGLILSYLVTQAFESYHYEYPLPIALLRLIAAVMGIYLGKLWKDKGFWLMIAYLAYKVVRIAVKEPNLLFTSQVSDNILNGLWVVAGCYALGRVMDISKMKLFLKVLATLWTTGTLVHCGIALYAAWTNQGILNLSGGALWGIDWHNRVQVSFYYPTTSGSAMNISAMIAFCALLSMLGIWKKVYFSMAFFVVLIVLALTDARTSFISTSVGIGVVFGCLIMNHVYCHWKKNGFKWTKRETVLSCIVTCISMVMISGISIFVLNSITPVFVQIRDHGGVLVSTAEAEETPQKLVISNRGFSGREALSGRDVVWENTIGYLLENPETLLFGDSIYNPMSGPNTRNGGEMGHCHNMVLQIVLESGIFGLLFVALFVVYVVYYAVRLMFGAHVPLWKRIIPAIPVSVLVGDLAECFGWFPSWNSQALVFLFVSVGIIVALGKKKEYHNISG